MKGIIHEEIFKWNFICRGKFCCCSYDLFRVFDDFFRIQNNFYNYIFYSFFGWIFGIKIKKTETESKNIAKPVRQSKFGANVKNGNLLNPKYEALPMRDITKGIPVITIFSMIAVYFINVILVAYYLKKEQKLPFLEGLSYSWMGVFKISSEIYTDWAWIILVAIVSVVVFIKAEKNEKLNKKN